MTLVGPRPGEMGIQGTADAVGRWFQGALRRAGAKSVSPLTATARLGPVLAADELMMLAKWGVLGLPSRSAPLARDRFELLDLALAQAPLTGLRLEFGVFQGESINWIARASDAPVHGFDSFQGLPEFWKPLPVTQKSGFDVGGRLPPVAPNVTLHRGWFHETLPPFVREHPEAVAFLHVDCDLYSSTRTVFDHLTDRLQTGTVIVFDEFCGMMPDDEARAWREVVRRRRISSRWLGCALNGSVALQVERLAPVS
jgi:hypothetical protein